MSSWISSWRASLRIARREVGQHKARNTLIVAMLALPVFGATTADTVAHSAQRSLGETLTRQLGQTDALVAAPYGGGFAIYQNPDASQSVPADPRSAGSVTGTTGQANIEKAAIQRALPNASLLDYAAGFESKIHTPDGYLSLNTVQFDLTNPATAGMVDLRSGRLPLTPDEILLSTAASKQLGTKVGASVTVSSRPGPFLVVGIADNPNALDEATVYALPNALAADSGQIPQWLVLSPHGVPWSAVVQLNKSGLLVTSRAVAANPPPRAEVPYYAMLDGQPSFSDSAASDRAAKIAIGVVTVGLILLEVVLLAGPAFAVSARRRQREYAIIGAAGADSRDLRRMVLADGLVLGALAGIAGAVAGIGGGAAVMPFIDRFTHVVPGRFQVKPLEVLGIAVLAAALGLAAAYAPARSVARQDILLSLTGRRVPQPVRWKLPVGGLVLVAVGMGGLYGAPDLAQDEVFSALIFLLGVAVMESGAIMCTPILVGALARVGRILPLGPRLALRDGARHRGRTTPAVAAMFAAVAGAVAAGTWFVSTDAQDRAAYKPRMLPNQVAVMDVGESGGIGPDALAAQLRSVLPVTDSFTVTSADASASMSGPKEVFVSIGVPCTELEGGTGEVVGVVGNACSVVTDGREITGAPIVDAQRFTELTGVSDPAATAMLNQGGAIVFDPRLVHDGKTTFQIEQITTATNSTSEPTNTTVPAVYVNLGGRPKPPFALSPAAAQRLGVRGGTETLVLNLSRHITSLELQRANKVLTQAGPAETLQVEDGYQSKIGAANLIILAVAVLVAMGAAGIATGLAIADGRPDQETLSAVGGSPATRRLLAGSTALVVTGLGALVGIPIGFAMAVGLMHFKSLWVVSSYIDSNSIAPFNQPTPFVVPWLNIAVAVIGVPLVTALGAMALTRSKVQLSRRIT